MISTDCEGHASSPTGTIESRQGRYQGPVILIRVQQLTEVTEIIELPALAVGYDEEARYFEAGVRGDKRAGLLSALQEAVWPLYETQLTALRARSLTEFKKSLKAALADGGEGFTSAATRCCLVHSRTQTI